MITIAQIATPTGVAGRPQELPIKEKELTRQRDALSTERRNLPMVEIEKDYVFDSSNGAVRLIDMFEGHPPAHHLPLG